MQPYFADWGGLIVFVGTFLENAAFVGAVIPGDVILLLAGLYAERGAIPLEQVMLLAFVGALLGDSVGYMLGRFAGRRIIDRFGHRVLLPQRRLERMDRYFREYGLWAVAIGRFAPAVRTVNTFAAGMSRMPYPRFLLAVAVAAGIWSILVPVLGFLFGGSLHFVRRSLGAVGVIVLILFAGLVFFSYRRMLRRLGADGRTIRGRRSSEG